MQLISCRSSKSADRQRQPESSRRRDKNRHGDGLILQPGGVVELVDYTRPAEFLQRGMQPQLFWRTNNRMPSTRSIAIGLKD